MSDDIRQTIQDFFSHYPLVKYPKEQVLLFPGDQATRVYYIVTGRVCQYDISYRGDEVVVNTFKPFAFFPMAMVINDFPSNFFYKAETNIEARIAPAVEVIAFMRANPEVTYDLLSRVYNGVESVLNRMVHLMVGTARSRVAFELLVELKRFGKQSGVKSFIEISEASIASRSGLSRETVSREIKRMKEKGLVEIKIHRIYIHNVAELEKQIAT